MSAVKAYDAAARMAYGLIRRKGREFVFTRNREHPSFDPVTQANAEGAKETLRMSGVALPPGRSAQKILGSLEGRNIVEVHLAPMHGEAPGPGWQFEHKGSTWNVLWNSEVDPVGEGAVYCLVYAER